VFVFVLKIGDEDYTTFVDACPDQGDPQNLNVFCSRRKKIITDRRRDGQTTKKNT